MRGVPAWRSIQHPSSVLALRANPPSPSTGEGRALVLNPLSLPHIRSTSSPRVDALAQAIHRLASGSIETRRYSRTTTASTSKSMGPTASLGTGTSVCAGSASPPRRSALHVSGNATRRSNALACCWTATGKAPSGKAWTSCSMASLRRMTDCLVASSASCVAERFQRLYISFDPENSDL